MVTVILLESPPRVAACVEPREAAGEPRDEAPRPREEAPPRAKLSRAAVALPRPRTERPPRAEAPPPRPESAPRPNFAGLVLGEPRIDPPLPIDDAPPLPIDAVPPRPRVSMFNIVGFMTRPGSKMDELKQFDYLGRTVV